MTSRDLPISNAAILVDVAAELGSSRPGLLAASGLTEEQLSQREGLCPQEQLRRLLGVAIETTGQSSLVLHFGQRLPFHSHDVIAYALLNCRNLRQAIDLLARHYRVLLNRANVSISVSDDRLSIEYRAGREPLLEQQQETELVFAGVIGVLRQLLHRERISAELELAYPAPPHQAVYRHWLDGAVHFNRDINAIHLPAGLLDTPPVFSHPALQQRQQQLSDQLLLRLEASDGLQAKVRTYLMLTQAQFPSLEQAADHFHMSPRTFRRRLSDEQVSFQKVLDDVRHALAEAFLQQPAISVNHTAELLGFHDVSNFRRAFLRWSSGTSPSEYKKQQLRRSAES